METKTDKWINDFLMRVLAPALCERTFVFGTLPIYDYYGADTINLELNEYEGIKN